MLIKCILIYVDFDLNHTMYIIVIYNTFISITKPYLLIAEAIEMQGSKGELPVLIHLLRNKTMKMS